MADIDVVRAVDATRRGLGAPAVGGQPTGARLVTHARSTTARTPEVIGAPRRRARCASQSVSAPTSTPSIISRPVLALTSPSWPRPGTELRRQADEMRP